MSKTADLLIELFSEEIPARMQLQAVQDYKRLFADALTKAQLNCNSLEVFVTPRRLSLFAHLPKQQPDRVEERRGPRIDAPEKAIMGFLRSAGLTSIADCEQRETGKGTFLFTTQHIKGQPTKELIPEILRSVITHFPWPKVMRWADNTQPWVRPLKCILCIFDGDTVVGTLNLGENKIEFSNTTYGHRFLAPDAIRISGIPDYQTKLEKAFVIIDQSRRRELIREQITQLADKSKITVIDDPKLLDEITGLVEWPQAFLGNIEPEFMALPKEVLITSMRVHQKYFALEDASGNLAPHFIVVANIKPEDRGVTLVEGNERVLRARLSDAKFFFDLDRKNPLESHNKELDHVIFHASLGSMGEKINRLEALAEMLAPLMSANLEQAKRSAHLCKADLMTEMVGEFPELQGIMGYHYALYNGEHETVAKAIEDHYKPRGPKDELPKDVVGDVVALADKLDTLVGFFAIDIKPTGAKDPYALRRTALGIIRIAERHSKLNLMAHFEKAYNLFAQMKRVEPRSKDQVLDDLRHFILDRLKVYWRDQGQRHDHIAAVFAIAKDTPLALLHQRVIALQSLMQDEGGLGLDLLAAYRRASNIVRIEEEKDKTHYNGTVNENSLVEPEEIALHKSLKKNLAQIETSLAQNNYKKSMIYLAELKPDIDAFFDKVLVNADSQDLRSNRLKMLSMIRDTFNSIADFGLIEG